MLSVCCSLIQYGDYARDRLLENVQMAVCQFRLAQGLTGICGNLPARHSQPSPQSRTAHRIEAFLA
jgi:hypothetical protein